MIATWPSTLPPPQRDSWQLQPQDARRKRQSDAGPPGYRRRFSAAARMVSLSVILTRDQRAVFDRFYHETCREGVVNFWIPDPTTDGWNITTHLGVPLLVDDVPGNNLVAAATWLCAWGDQTPVETIVQQVKFQKAFEIVVLP